MKAIYDFQLLSQAVVLGLAITWTLAYVNHVIRFYVRAMNKQEATIPPFQVELPAILWAIFFWLMRAQF
jgi:hypothetical protein